MAVHRKLCPATLNPELAILGYKSAAVNVSRWHEQFQDAGASYYYRRTIGCPHAPPYTDRVSMAKYMAALSAILLWLTGALKIMCHAR